MTTQLSAAELTSKLTETNLMWALTTEQAYTQLKLDMDTDQVDWDSVQALIEKTKCMRAAKATATKLESTTEAFFQQMKDQDGDGDFELTLQDI